MKIGQIAQIAGIGIDTIRFYERRGVLPAPVRRASGYREYGMATVERIRFVRALREMGFCLDDVIDLLAEADAGRATCVTERPRFELVLARVDRKLAELRRVRRRLRATIERCATGNCSLVDARR